MNSCFKQNIMKKIILRNIIDSTPALTESGDDFYRELSMLIAKDEKIVVDMTGVGSLPSVFLNISIGRVIDEYGLVKLREHVSFVSITRQQASRLREYVSKYQYAMEFT